ncbi:MAG: dihydroorotate dehydrogenase electron transfer subunit [Ignavibacteriaceae bacterium]|nr:dihydroorotate dehydrogenase electron transfer subunit [Ignavibacteria bacterium]MBT8393183.1 dihydroorotate dehydrogenase electron transfer subunit [Ignavibacteria bacterium]NNL21261.1 dihydroorotate dehydrogenase electron transfer subunit [Ignavibacteriaceae bacterium]
MKIIDAPVKQHIELDHNIFLIKLFAPEITSIIKPGQFLNVRVSESVYPLLRRPFSVCDIEGDNLYLMFNIMGQGTKILANKPIDSTIDILGPLGNGFNLNGDYDTAVIVAGGLGAAPFPFFTRSVEDKKEVQTYIGGKTYHDVIKYGMNNINVATDDGSEGFNGNIVQLLFKNLHNLKSKKVKIFACGPTPMLRALKTFCIENEFECEASTECAMACGFGICQGCPIESTQNPEKYLLVCKDGPVFNVKDVVI